jgi:glycosyltransferase XagB
MILFGAFMIIILFILIKYPESFLIYTVYGTSIFYIMWAGYHLVVFLAGHKVLKDVPYETLMKDPSSLPKISIIIPAMNEPILARTIEACLNHTDYPMEKKEIIVVVDDTEGERIGFWYQQKYPKNIKLLSRRKRYPTKPSALNDSLHLCTGEIIGIMDVEDIPDRDVFLKAAHALSGEGRATQAILRISNPQDSWVSNIFSMEYAGWFRILLNGRARLGLYAPLGGTGNYFKRSALVHVGLYDSTNLAEDAELSIRLRIAGWNVGVLNSRHWEEAPLEFKPWLKQRTRWYRGWLQSLWKYIPIMMSLKSVKRMGLVGAFSTLMMLVAPLIVILNWLTYGVTLLWFLEITKIIPVQLMTVISFPFWIAIPVTFNIMYLSIWLAGAKFEGIPVSNFHKLIPQMIWYMNLMMPIAASRALYQEIFQPVVWEKTTHEGRGVMWGMVKG